MIKVKLADSRSPSLSFQAIDTSETEVIAKPRPIGFVSSITAWMVAAMGARIGVIENQFPGSSSRTDSSFACKAFIPSIGWLFSESTTIRIASVSRANSICS